MLGRTDGRPSLMTFPKVPGTCFWWKPRPKMRSEKFRGLPGTYPEDRYLKSGRLGFSLEGLDFRFGRLALRVWVRRCLGCRVWWVMVYGWGLSGRGFVF